MLIITIQAILLISCGKNDKNYILDNYILAGQKERAGIEYVDLNPDINCTIIDPWRKTDTIIHLDLNKDGINDFTLKGSMCHPSMLGGDCEELSIIPLSNNEICINPITNWLDTIPLLDSIFMNKNWSNDEALIYSYMWVMGSDAATSGHWQDVTTSGKYFIGYKIQKDEKIFYGWIGIKRDPTTWSFSFLLTDYAILREYEE